MKRKHSRWSLVLALLGGLGALTTSACHHDGDSDSDETSGDETSVPPAHRGSPRAEMCPATGDEYVQMPYDTNGDGAADVIRVFRVTANTTDASGTASTRRIVCREADLNNDGTRDVMRVYDDAGRAAREQQDRDFDGRPDFWEFYEDGRLIRTDEDANRDGRVDTRVYLDLQGRPERIERDAAARSVSGRWSPDHFEFFVEGRLTRSGEDTDLDGTVDRWDRDRVFEAEQEARQRALQSGANPSEAEDEAPAN